MFTKKLQIMLIGGMVLLVTLFSFVHSRVMLYEFEHALSPIAQDKAVVIKERLGNLIKDLTMYGVPINRFRDMDKVFNQIQEGHPDISYLAIKDHQSNVLYSQTVLETATTFFSVAEADHHQTTPDKPMNVELLSEVMIYDDNSPGVIVEVGIDKAFQEKKQKEIMLDSMTVLLVSMLITMELLVFLFVFTIKTPFNTLKEQIESVSKGDFSKVYFYKSNDEIGRIGQMINRLIVKFNRLYYDRFDNQTPQPVSTTVTEGKQHYQFGNKNSILTKLSDVLIYVRPPLFLVIFAESMSLSFFPAYVESLYANMETLAISKDLVISLPISIFMLVWALSLPLAGQWSDTRGRRKSFLIGATITGIGLVCTAFSQNLIQLLVFRSLTAVGYALVFITAQGYVTDLTTSENRTKGMALFLSSFFSGSLCGASIGGILADRIGYEYTFILSAIMAVGSAFFAVRFFVDKARNEDEVKAPLFKFSDMKALFSNRNFLFITFLSSIPAKAALTGIVYFVGPVYLAQLGATKSDAGRILMSYGLAIILISPLTAMAVDHFKKPKQFIFLGGVLSAMALISVAYFNNILGVALGIAGLGIAHAFSVSPQSSLITSTVPESSGLPLGKTIGLYRLTERLGNISGPLVAALLIGLYGFQDTFLIFAAVIFLSSALFYFTVKTQ